MSTEPKISINISFALKKTKDYKNLQAFEMLNRKDLEFQRKTKYDSIKKGMKLKSSTEKEAKELIIRKPTRTEKQEKKIKM